MEKRSSGVKAAEQMIIDYHAMYKSVMMHKRRTVDGQGVGWCKSGAEDAGCTM